MCRAGSKPVRNPEVMWKQLGTEVVTLNRKTSQYHVLNSAAALIFLSADGVESVEVLAGKLAEEFGVQAEEALSDVRETVDGMEELGLLRTEKAVEEAYDRPSIREISLKEFESAVAGGAAIACRSLLG